MYTINPNADEPIMLLNKHIGYNDEDGQGIDGPAFAAELLALDQMGKKRIVVWINSTGGSVMQGFDIYNAILHSQTKVDTFCQGVAASISAVIFQAGRNRIMADFGQLMYHNPFGSDDKQAVNAMRDSIVRMICSRTGMDDGRCAAMMARTTWIGASEALKTNMCDTIEASSAVNKKRMSAISVENDAAGYFRTAAIIVNSLLTNKTVTNMDFAKIANRLDLNEAASENAILKEIDRMSNKLTAAEASLTEVRNQITTKDLEIARLTGIVNQANADKATAEVNAKKVEVTAFVNEAAELGKIKNDADTKAFWIDRGVKDAEGVKLALDSIPVNASAKKLQNNAANASQGGAVVTSAGADLGGIKNYAAKSMGKILAEKERANPTHSKR